jgi:ribosomal protein L23
VSAYTKSDGVAKYNVGFNAGKYTVTTTFEGASATYAFEIAKAPAKIKVKKKLTTYFGNKPLKIKVINTATKKRINGVRLMVIVTKGKKSKKFYVTTQVKGTAYFWGSDLKAGKYKVKIKCDPNQASAKAKKSKLKIKKTDGKITIKKKSAGAGKYSQFIIKLKNTKNNKKISYAKVKIKVTNGKKTKVLKERTNYYGKVVLHTLKWPAGKYKFKIACKSSAVTAEPRKKTLKIS